jgi:hypothetical protein
MSERMDQVRLQDGTLIRHKVAGYEGRIDGTTGIKTCFTSKGKLLDKLNNKQTFQYRVVIKGETMRRIAPAEDMEILEGVVEVTCPGCQSTFQTKPGLVDKPGGRCQCGGWICPNCLVCRDASKDATENGKSPCVNQRKRLAKKSARQKKNKAAG